MGERSEYAPCNYILNHAENDDMHMYDTIGINDATPMEENLAYHVVRAILKVSCGTFMLRSSTQTKVKPTAVTPHNRGILFTIKR